MLGRRGAAHPRGSDPGPAVGAESHGPARGGSSGSGRAVGWLPRPSMVIIPPKGDHGTAPARELLAATETGAELSPKPVPGLAPDEHARLSCIGGKRLPVSKLPKARGQLVLTFD